MLVYALIIEAYSDDSRLLGIYASKEDAISAYKSWSERVYYPVYRIEEREMGAIADECSSFTRYTDMED